MLYSWNLQTQHVIFLQQRKFAFLSGDRHSLVLQFFRLQYSVESIGHLWACLQQ